MKPSTFYTIRAIMLVGIILATVWAISVRSVLVVLFAVMGGLALLSLVKLRVKGVLEDERIVSVADKAARVSFRILLPILGFTSLALFSAGGSQDFFYIKALGIILGYITSLALIIYLGAYWYINRESGGA